MFSTDPATEFAPSARSPIDDLRRQADLFHRSPPFEQVANAVPNILMVLNANRQIVFANDVTAKTFSPEGDNALLGLRPGEAMSCVHASETPGGCGTTRYCQHCGGVRSVLICQRGEANVQECRITQEKNLGSLDLRVTATPLTVGGEPFTVFSAMDVADEKRRESLERIFFHDVLNTAAGLQGYADLLHVLPPDEQPAYIDGVRNITRTLIEEIRAQQDLSAAEKGEMEVVRRPIDAASFLKDLVQLYTGMSVAQTRRLVMSPESASASFTSDERLLHRVVGNMLKNALEASRSGSTVTAGCSSADAKIRFWVHNAGFMPPEIQLQVFQRSFSTKGRGRGLGTYSIKLLTEKYLGGSVSFRTSTEEGTTFWIDLPLQPNG